MYFFRKLAAGWSDGAVLRLMVSCARLMASICSGRRQWFSRREASTQWFEGLEADSIVINRVNDPARFVWVSEYHETERWSVGHAAETGSHWYFAESPAQHTKFEGTVMGEEHVGCRTHPHIVISPARRGVQVVCATRGH